MVIGFLYVPLLLTSLAVEEYAIWLTLTSVVSWIVMFDIGLGNGLRNKLSEMLALEKYHEAQKYVSTAYISILGIGFTIILIFLLSFLFVDWTDFLNAHGIPQKELNLLVIIVGVAFIIQFQLGLLNSVLLALKKPALSSAIGCVGQILSYIIVILEVKVFQVNNLIILGSIISIVPILVLLIATVILFSNKYKFLKPSFYCFDRQKFRDIFSLGALFFWLQIVTIILFQLNNLIIIHIVGAEEVVEYNICYKYFYLLVTLFVIICTPFWSSTTHEYAKGNIAWIKIINKKLMFIACILSIAGLVMFFLAKPIYKLWIGEDCPEIDNASNILMYLYCVFMMFYSANGYIINGIGKLRLQAYITSFLAICYIPMAIYGGKEFGLNGVLVALVLNAAVNSLWSSLQLNKILNHSASGIWLK